MIVTMVAGWIVWQPHGLVRRPIAWLIKHLKGKMLLLVRTIIVALFVFSLGLVVLILNN